MAKTKVLVVDDESIIRSLVSNALTGLGYEVSTASSAAEARSVDEDFGADVYCLDIELGKGANGIDLAHIFRSKSKDAPIVFLTNIPEPRFVGASSESIPRGSAYLYKSKLEDPNELAFAIECARRKKVDAKLRDDKNPERPLKQASRSQIEVLHMVALGMSNQEIANQRNTTLRAVENLINRACDSLGIEREPGSNLRVKAARAFIKASGLPSPK